MGSHASLSPLFFTFAHPRVFCCLCLSRSQWPPVHVATLTRRHWSPRSWRSSRWCRWRPCSCLVLGGPQCPAGGVEERDERRTFRTEVATLACTVCSGNHHVSQRVTTGHYGSLRGTTGHHGGHHGSPSKRGASVAVLAARRSAAD